MERLELHFQLEFRSQKQMALEFLRTSSRIPIFEWGKVFFFLYVLSLLQFQIAEFSKWIKCTQKHAIEGKKSTTSVKRACDKSKYYKNYAVELKNKVDFTPRWQDINEFNGFLPKCNHTELHFEGILPYWNSRPYC